MKTLDDLLKTGVKGRRILVRSDLNVPIKDGKVTDDKRIRASLPVLTRLIENGARVIVAAHLGRPKGAPDPQYSLSPVADRLAQLLGRPVEFALDTVGESARLLAADLKNGEVLLLENVRFNAGETSKDEAERTDFARCLEVLTGGEDEGGAFVNDAFGAVHRKHASVYDIAKRLPHYCGDLVRDELQVLKALTGEPERPYAVVLGGSKVSDKLAVIESLLPKVDKLLVGGGMCFTFLAAQGHEVGDSLLGADVQPLLPGRDRRGRRDPGRAEGAGHRPRLGTRVHGRAGRREDRVLERPNGRVRGSAVRGRHQGRRRSGRRDEGPVGRRRRRLGRRGHQARARQERLRAHLHRRRRVARVPRRQGAPRRCGSGRSLRWPVTVPGDP